MNTQYRSITLALKDFFGYLPGQSLQEFGAEIKALTTADKEWFVGEFVKLGISFTG